jgi:two-component system chemotaxis response regulator CheY
MAGEDAMRALIVDDSRSMRSILGRILSQLGIEVSEAADGNEALSRLASGERVDFAFVDWHMPVMDGLQFVATLRSRAEPWSSLPIMMVSTESDNEHIMQALSAGANEYMVKPFTADAVSEKLGLLGIEDSFAESTNPIATEQEQAHMEIVAPSNQVIFEIVDEVWSSFLDGAGELIRRAPDPEALPDRGVLASIQITGRWNGSVRISCSIALARRIAASMFAKEEAEVADDELADAVGEFTNIVGGNVKALFPGPCSLSLPGVSGLGEFGTTLPPQSVPTEGVKVREVQLAWMSEPLVVSLWEDS